MKHSLFSKINLIISLFVLIVGSLLLQKKANGELRLGDSAEPVEISKPTRESFASLFGPTDPNDRRGPIINPNPNFKLEDHPWVENWAMSVSSNGYKNFFRFDVNLEEIDVLLYKTDEPRPITMMAGVKRFEDIEGNLISEEPQYATFIPEAYSVRESTQGIARTIRGKLIFNEKEGYFNIWYRNGYIYGNGHAGGIPPNSTQEVQPAKFIKFKLSGTPSHLNMVWF